MPDLPGVAQAPPVGSMHALPLRRDEAGVTSHSRGSFSSMPAAPLRTLRYTLSWLTGRDSLAVREIQLDRDGTAVPATLLQPRRARDPLPAWVVMHGITRPGRAHPQLVRFTRAVASGGCAVLVPEVPEWRDLRLATDLTVPTVQASLAALDELPEIAHRPVGLVGFSFGAPQAIAASAHPDLRDRIAGVVGFGGFCDLERTLRFQFTGHHEWKGQHYHLQPDPYGRWIAGGNYLTEVPGHEGEAGVAEALLRLAMLAGDVGVMAWEPVFDEAKRELRNALSPAQQEVFDLFAPLTRDEPDREVAEGMATALAEAGQRVEPTLQAAQVFPDVRGPIHLIHGRQDRLIPFSEAFRLRNALPAGVVAGPTVTSLFAHSSQDPFPGLLGGARETAAFFRALSRALGLV